MYRLGSGVQSAHAALGTDLCTDTSCALLHATDARLCAADIFGDTSTSPVVDAIGCGSWELGETYVCDFVPKFAVCSAPAGSMPDTCDADARRWDCSGLDRGVQVVMRNMIQPFRFCEGERGLVLHVQRGKLPLFWVIAWDMNVSMEIVKINSRRKNYCAPCKILMLQRYQLEQCADS
jgi:hypothetical protein